MALHLILRSGPEAWALVSSPLPPPALHLESRGDAGENVVMARLMAKGHVIEKASHQLHRALCSVTASNAAFRKQSLHLKHQNTCVREPDTMKTRALRQSPSSIPALSTLKPCDFQPMTYFSELFPHLQHGLTNLPHHKDLLRVK